MKHTNPNAISITERSWAIDVIGEINHIAQKGTQPIKVAGGEMGVGAQGATTLYPDIFLFGNASRSLILQGWELKMPDTPVTDTALIRNATEKARRLGTTSFVLWNGTSAVLYCHANDDWAPSQAWTDPTLKTRSDIATKRTAWVSLLETIINDLNRFIQTGSIASPPLPKQLDELITCVLERTRDITATHIKQQVAHSQKIRTKLAVWWRTVKAEHGAKDDDDPKRFNIRATEYLLHWIHRFIFAHYMKSFVNDACAVAEITRTTTVKDAESIFEKLTAQHDFAHILKPQSEVGIMPPDVWQELTQFNAILNATRISEIPQDIFQSVLQNIRQSSQIKIAGQFCTPPQLARLLALLTLDSLDLPVLDPCCGTGTIAKAAYDLKRENGISPSVALNTVWASDRYATPLLFASLVLSSGDTPFEMLHLFQHDAMTLCNDEQIAFTSPQNGARVSEKLPKFSAIVLNPPFIRFEDWAKNYRDTQQDRLAIEKITEQITDMKSDFFAPIILHLRTLLETNGRIGAVFPNTWLGTEWAAAFREKLRKYFTIEVIVTSGCGRWFQNAKIVTNLVVLKSKESSEREHLTRFAVLNRKLDSYTPDEIKEVADTILTETPFENPLVSINALTQDQLNALDDVFDVCWASHFVNLSWLQSLHHILIPASQIFQIKRGERRGWDKLFFPEKQHSIEPIYLAPVLKTASASAFFVAEPDAVAFCCSRSMQELRTLKHHGALEWIQKFEHEHNEKGTLLSQVLARSGMYWYEMRPDTQADVALSMNPDKRLFFMRLQQRAFVNQRLIRFTANAGCTDVQLYHALLCSLLGCFYQEALGFGRGLGALDINATKMSHQLKMLNPSLLSAQSKKDILDAFSPLLKRPVLPFEEEMNDEMRLTFERAVLGAYAKTELFEKIRCSTLKLYHLRHTATENTNKSECG